MGIVDRYQQTIYDMYIKTHPNANPEKVSSLIQQLTNEHLRDIPCKMHNNITHEVIETTVSGAIDLIEKDNPIISGNGTFFKQHSEELSPTVKMLEKLQYNRGVKKDEMYTYAKGSIDYINAMVAQMSIKVIMNADYGGSGTPLSPFYSQYIPPATTGTAKAITTTLICCLEFLSDNDNKWTKMNNINELFDMIHIVLKTPNEDRELIHDTYSVNEVAQRLISRTNNLTLDDVKTLKVYLSSLTNDELTKLMLAFNIRLVLSKYLYSTVGGVMSYFKQHPVDFDNITKESLQESGFGVKAPDAVIKDIEYISKVVCDNCVYPFMLNDNEVRANNAERVIVCVTDTDSLMVQFASYLDEFQARTDNFRDSCIYATALGMRLFVEGIIPAFVEYIAISMNIEDKYYRDKFVFKNEFAFLSMALFAKKMYAASMFVQEGKPRNPHDIAVTGLSFKKRDAAEFLEPIMLNLYDKYILTSKDVNISGVLDEFHALRNMLKESIGTDPSYYKMLSVKDPASYATATLPAQVRGSIVWNNIMPDEEILPMDRVIVIPLSFKLMQEHADIGKVSDVLRLSLIDNENMKRDPYICLPEYYKTIPEWIQPIIDIDYAIDKLLAPFKQILGMFDVYLPETRGGMTASRMIFI